ncbi:serine hydrolase domain-containing protein [Azoarcus olearius]|uniref:Penicillin-binding protein n=1 Tax=Azoarcus sp. (strain BH72) TaxID=418699 RepID=A1K256_AZOSB|nr:serine hydrolase domain-containing protein [Azoarcus olearius]ANQ83384.1 putative penicillin-binding protein [Azoarcus olearius]CAL92911.1 putative penicillin-binding protein [Azoarcus olearius]
MPASPRPAARIAHPVAALARRLLAPAAILLLGACAAIQPPPRPAHVGSGDYAYTRDYLRWLIGQEMEENRITGLSIALVDDQRVVWAEGFGKEDAERDVAAGPHTRYRMGSIAKVLTATAAMQMAERGEIDIDRPLADYLPGFSVRSRFDDRTPITPRNIMHHHSGLPANYLKGMMGGDPPPFTTLVEAVREEYVAYPPEFIFGYSNLAVTLLGAALEQRAGLPFADHMAKSLIEPLGMTETRFESNPALRVYDARGQIEALPLRDLPSGGLVSSVADMSRFMRMVFAGGRSGNTQLLRPETLHEMLRAQNEHIALDLGFRVGLGWLLSGIEIRNAGLVASHGGTLFDSHSMMVVLPEHKLGVIVASNSGTSQGTVKKIATEALIHALEAKAGIRQPEAAAIAQPEVRLAPEQLASYSAWYDSMVGLIRVKPRAGALDADVMGHTLQLRAQPGGQFGLRYKLFGLIPVQVGAFDGVRISAAAIGGHEVLVGHFGDDTMLVGEKLAPRPIPRTMLDYVGEYEIVGKPPGLAPDRLALRVEDGMLIGECSFSELPGFMLRIALNPISPTEAVISGLGTGKGETIRILPGEGRRLLFSGLELRQKTN